MHRLSKFGNVKSSSKHVALSDPTRLKPGSHERKIGKPGGIVGALGIMIPLGKFGGKHPKKQNNA